MLAALTVALAAILAGTVATYFYTDSPGLPTRFAFGASTGLAALALVGFVLSNFVDLGLATVVTTVLLLAMLATLTSPVLRAAVARDVADTLAHVQAAIRRPSLRTTGPLIYFAAAIVLLWIVFSKVVIEQGGAIYTGYVNNLGDLPFHMQVTASFAYGQNFPPEDPTYAGTGFAYPYLSDFVAAVFVRLGISIREAFVLQNMILGLSLVGVLHRFAWVVTRDRLAAAITPVLVLFSGGLGWLMLVDEARRGEQGILRLLGAPPHDYTILSDGPLRWGNAITTLLVTQRSLLFGLPLAIIVFTLLWELIHLEREGVATAPMPSVRPAAIAAGALRNRRALAAGVLTGFLPLIHAHSFVVVLATAFLMGLVFRQWRDKRWFGWAVYVLVALTIGLPEIWFSTHNSIANAGTFFGFEFGWDHGQTNILWFWLANTGLFIPLLLAAAVWRAIPPIAPRSLLLFTLPFLTWFIVPNVMRLAPWVWDNIKVLFYWYVGCVPLVALALARMLRARGAIRVGAVALVITLVLSGGLDVWRVISGQTEYQEFDSDGVAIANLILARTPPRSLILHAPTYNPPVFLTGRRSLLGYTGYIWAHGLDYGPREAAIKQIYAGSPEAEALLSKYGVDYVLVSPIERNYMPVSDAFFARFTEVAQSGGYRLFKIAQP